MTLIKNSLSTTQEMTRSFTVLRQDTGSTGSKIIRHKRQHSDSSGRNVSLRSLKRSLSSTIRTYKNATQKQPPKGMGNKSHHKSALSLNASKISERNTSKKRLNTKISKNSIGQSPIEIRVKIRFNQLILRCIIQRVEFYLDVVKIKERVLLESFYSLNLINKESSSKYAHREEENLLSLDLNKVEEHGASVNSQTYDLYHLAYTLPNSIDDPIIKCIYFAEISLNYDTCFKMDPTVIRVQIEIFPKSIYDVKVCPMIQEQNIKI